ncbi:peptidase T [Lacticaseibacillus absianus]|uniref:peptidase T n=1 Tax=Lacticaseibacillus absianus TaxID=2729623 RepID=UPI001C5390C5|nr:peptidase T [Lacticaseibacillus absianus]
MELDLSTLQADFLRYVQINTRSDERHADRVPSTPGQTELASALVAQLTAMALVDVRLDPANGYVTATLPATTDAPAPSIGWIAHLDTADYPADQVRPQLHPNYTGEPIVFANGLRLDTTAFPALRQYFGQTLITGDGTTLLGVDDKAGIAAAIAAVRYLQAHPAVAHGEIKLAFGPDEEIGAGADRFDAKGFATDWAYTLDNGDLGQIEYETFNAAQAVVTVTRTSVHPGEAKDLMVNAITLAEQLDAALPRFERPEYTAGREGFYLLHDFSGTIQTATLTYIIRAFDRAEFDARKAAFAKVIDTLNAAGDTPRYAVTMKDQYYNMADIIDRDRTPLTLAERAIEAAGLTPHYLPFRGGTDGSKITYLGIPTPNLFNGGINFHGPYECVSTEAMGKLAETLVHLAQLAVN